MNTKLLALTIAAAIAAAGNQIAFASTFVDPNVANSDHIGTGYVAVAGSVSDSADTRPWTAEIYAGFGECVRVWVETQTFDSAITLITPGGALYRDDDSGGSNRPLVMIPAAPVSGYYTVQVAHYSGSPTAGNFSLRYGRYNAGNANCGGATEAMVPPFSGTNK
jgi:hypothetical protein